MLGEEVYIVHIIEGSILDPSFLANIPHQFKKKLENPNWGRLVEAQLTIAQVREAQKRMVKHYRDASPWYLEGFLAEDPNIIICAFGADDEEGGRIFIFERGDKESYMECKQYGISQGVPEDEMDFLG